MIDNTPTRWVLDKEDFDFFVAALDEPPRLIPELAALFREFPPFDEPKVTDD